MLWCDASGRRRLARTLSTPLYHGRRHFTRCRDRRMEARGKGPKIQRRTSNVEVFDVVRSIGCSMFRSHPFPARVGRRSLRELGTPYDDFASWSPLWLMLPVAVADKSKGHIFL